MGDSPCLKWQKQQDDLNVCGPKEYKFVFLVQDVHPLSILFKMGGIARPPSAHSPPSPGAVRSHPQPRGTPDPQC